MSLVILKPMIKSNGNADKKPKTKDIMPNTDKTRLFLFLFLAHLEFTNLKTMLRIIPPIPSTNRNKEILAIIIAINAITILLSI